MVHVGARGHGDHARESSGQRPERVALAREPAAREPAGEADRDHERDRTERGRRAVDVQPAREDRRGDEEARRIEAVEAGEDQHQPHQREVRVVPSEAPREAVLRVLPDAWPQVEEDTEREDAGDTVHDAGRDRIVEAEADGQPAAGAPAPGGVQDPDERAEDRREDEVRREPHALDERAGHDRARRPGEEEEREEEDAVQVVLEVRAHLVGPRSRLPAEARELHGAVVTVERVGADPGKPLLEAAVDVPAEVVEGRRDDGDRQDVLHRRRHEVLAPGGACLVRHEAGVDQPHHDDGPEVELLEQDVRAQVDLGLELFRRWRSLRKPRRDQREHSTPTSSGSVTRSTMGRRYEPGWRVSMSDPADVRSVRVWGPHTASYSRETSPVDAFTRKLSVRFGTPSASTSSDSTTPQ